MYGGYGGGMSSMYGGGLGGMGGMSSMYGGGLGGMGGMSSMYGGGMGGMSSMYGGGLGGMGGMSSMYGGGLGGMGGMSSMYGGGMIGGGMPGSINTGIASPNGQVSNSLLPPQSDQPQNNLSGRPAIDESPQERRARRRQERKEEKEAVEKHRQQKRQFAIHSTIEVAGHVLQILIQVMRSGLELFGVGFGTYYSVKALKALVKSQESAVPRAVTREVVSKSKNEVSGGSAPTGTRKWKTWVLISALFIIMETVYGIYRRSRDVNARRAINRTSSNILTTDDENEEFNASLTQSEEFSSDDENSDYSTESKSNIIGGKYSKNGKSKRIYVAVFDYQSPDREGFIGFKAGDRFVIEEYAENGWCEAFLMDDEKEVRQKGLVPGNFLRPLEGETKL